MQNHEEFTFWTPDEETTLLAGPEQNEVPLPHVPLPIYSRHLKKGPPSTAAIGESIYDYLRRDPDCVNNKLFAHLLRDAFPHYIADIGSNAVMLDARDISAAYLHRKINLLKILHLLDDSNAGLFYLLGQTYFELLHEVSEFANSRTHLLNAHRYLHQALKLGVEDVALYNLLGELDFLLGDYPSAVRRFEKACELLPDDQIRVASQLKKRVQFLQHQEPVALLDEMETVGEALLTAGQGDYASALEILEPVAEQGRLLDYFQCAQVPYMIGVCREKLGDISGAMVAYQEALDLAPDYELAVAARDRLIGGDANE